MQKAFDEVKYILFGENHGKSNQTAVNMPTSERKGPGGLFDGINGRLKLSPKIEPKFKAQLKARVDLGTTQRLSFGKAKEQQHIVKSARKSDPHENIDGVTFSKLIEQSE